MDESRLAMLYENKTGGHRVPQTRGIELAFNTPFDDKAHLISRHTTNGRLPRGQRRPLTPRFAFVTRR